MVALPRTGETRRHDSVFIHASEQHQRVDKESDHDWLLPWITCVARRVCAPTPSGASHPCSHAEIRSKHIPKQGTIAHRKKRTMPLREHVLSWGMTYLATRSRLGHARVVSSRAAGCYTASTCTSFTRICRVPGWALSMPSHKCHLQDLGLQPVDEETSTAMPQFVAEFETPIPPLPLGFRGIGGRRAR